MASIFDNQTVKLNLLSISAYNTLLKKFESLKTDYHTERIYCAIKLFSIEIRFVCMRNGNGTLQSEYVIINNIIRLNNGNSINQKDIVAYVLIIMQIHLIA